MKYLIILSLFLFSCSPQFHINKAKKHTNKAIDKGAVFSVSNDTLYVNDTIITERTFKVNDTLYIERTKTVERVVYQKGEIRYITKKDKRKEVKAQKIESKREFKLDKIKEKTKRVVARKENKRAFWWIWLVIGLLIGFFLDKILRK